MPIPHLDDAGLLPPGVHDCTLEEVGERFGRFQRTDHRCRLFAKLKQYVKEARSTGFGVALIIDGSFATGKDEPEDIDLVLVLKPGHDFLADLRPFQYNVVSKKRVRKNYRFDLYALEIDSPDYVKMVDFFQQVRDQDLLKKGILRVSLE